MQLCVNSKPVPKSKFISTSLNISTGHWTISGRKSSYVPRKLLHNGHSCPSRSYFFLSYRRLKTPKHSINIGLSFLVFLFMNILIGNLSVFLIFKIVRYVAVCCCFALRGTASPLNKNLCQYIALKS